MKRHRIPLWILLLTVSHASYASRVVFQKLEDMISSVQVITAGTVRKVEPVTGGCCPLNHYYTVEISEVLAGKLQAKSFRVVYVERGSPHFSLIVPASGIEHDLKVGDRFIFLFESAGEQKGVGLVLTRAEPEEQREAVLKAWKEREQKTKNDNK